MHMRIISMIETTVAEEAAYLIENTDGTVIESRVLNDMSKFILALTFVR